MASPSPKEFIEAALFASSPHALSYSNSKQKWLVLRHLLSLLREYPSFRPSTGRFMHNDGTQVNLLRASGCVHVSNSAPPIPLAIWIHENYPQKAPLVFVLLDPASPTHRHHPFVNASGTASPPYILTWKYPPCNVSDLLRNLVRLFSLDHPFSYAPSATSFTHPSLVSTREALDRLVGMVYYDMVALQASALEEIEELSMLQEKLKKRDRFTTGMISEMEQERKNLKEKADNWADETDRLENWLRVHDRRPKMVEEAFEIDENSRVRLDSSAADLAIEDLLYILDEALEQEAVSFDSYIKQVRSLAREQFFHKLRKGN